LSFKIPLLKKYVDDIICIIPNNADVEILEVFNNHDPHIKFTIEKEDDNNSVPFLDTKLMRRNNILLLDWYVKPTSSGRYLNYNSTHSEKMKTNLVLGLKHRIYKISHRTLYQKNIKLLFNTLVGNSYPPRLLSRLLYKTPIPPSLSETEENAPPQQDDEEVAVPRFAVLPNIEDVTAKLIHTFKDLNTKVAKKNMKTVNGLFTNLKDPVKIAERSNIVYRIPCQECPLTYIGQTSRTLHSRLISHKSDIRLNKNSCALADHCLQTNHRPAYDSATVLDTHRSTVKRNFVEMIRISQEENSMNRRSDISNLSLIYTLIIEKDRQLRLHTRPIRE